jgi:hypothetical protein
MDLTNGIGFGLSPIVADGISPPYSTPSALNIASTGSALIRSELDSD